MSQNSQPSDDELRATLRAAMDTADWSWLTRHLERDAVIVVSQELDLVETAVKIAKDDAAQIQKWIEQGKIAKPTRSQIDHWEKDPAHKLQSLVVQPYVLIQEFLH